MSSLRGADGGAPAAGVAAALLGGAAILPALADEPAETACALITREDAGAPVTTPMDGFSVLAETAKAGPFALPRGAPRNVQALFCRRSSILPAVHDDEVLAAGYTLYVTDELGRVAALGLVDGEPRLDVLEGALTEAEEARVAQRLAEFGARGRGQ